jgi:HD-GYP domain-containing protein (c-di-GMP phosphodiesterase class II)
MVKHHPEIGYRILNTSREFMKISEYVLAHHEKIDGSGYPQGLKGEEIIWQSKVIAVADSYDAMTCDRPYRKALSREEAVEEIIKNAGTQFDPEVARVFIEKVLGMKYDKG